MGGGIFYGKYSYDFKLKVVSEYLEGKGGYRYLAEKHKISNRNKKQVQNWVNEFRIADPDALREKSKGRRAVMQSLRIIKNYVSLVYVYKHYYKPNILNGYLRLLKEETTSSI